MLINFENNKESFGKKGDMLRKLYNLLFDEDNVYIPETLVLSLEFFNNTLTKDYYNDNNYFSLFNNSTNLYPKC